MEEWMYLAGLLVLAAAAVGVVVPVITLVLVRRLRDQVGWLDDQQQERHRAMQRQLTEIRQQLGTAAPPTPTPVTPAPVAPSRPAAPVLPPVLAAAPARPAPVPAMAPVRTPQAPLEPSVFAEAPPFAAKPAPAAPAEPSRPPSELEARAMAILRGIWSWIVVGEEHRPQGVTWEFAFATNWLMRLGVLAFLFFLGFFVKYSLDHGFFSPELRVAMTLAGGAALVVGGVRLLGKRYHLLGLGLAGGGLAAFYFGVFASCAYHHFIGPLPAFVLMAAVTVGAGFLSVRLNSLFLALVGLAGGYLTPVLVNTGEKNLPGLYAYLLLLGVGVLAVSMRRNWRLLTLLGLAATWALYFGALDRFYDRSADFPVAIGFLIAYFVLFSAVAVLHGLRRGEPLTLVELFELLANAGIAGVAGIQLVTGAHGREWAALFTAGMSLFYQLHIALFLKRRVQDKALLVCLTMLAAVFLAVTLPLLVGGRWLTLAWAVQALAMLWAADKLGSRFLRQLALVVYLAVLGRLVFADLPALGWRPSGETSFGAWLQLFLRHLLSFGGPLLMLAGGWKLLQRSGGERPAAAPVEAANDIAGGVPEPGAGGVLLTVCLAGAFLLLEVELWHGCGAFCPPLRLPALSLGLVLAAVLLLLWHVRTGRVWALAVGLAAAAALVAKLVGVDLPSWSPVFDTFGYEGACAGLDIGLRALDFGAACLFLGWAACFLTRTGGDSRERRLAGALAGTAALALLFLWLTLEVSHVLAQFLPGLRAGGVSILWALFAISLLFAGIRAGQRRLRVAGLALFAVTFAKVFLSDLERLDALYRILALFVVALLLGAGSFLYLRQSQKFQEKQPDTPS